MRDEDQSPESSNTLGILGALENGDADTIRSLVGDAAVKQSGVIRPGIRKPVNACSQAQKDLYAKLLAEDRDFDEIDKALLALEAKGSSRKSCLTMANADYWTVRDSDFRDPRNAQLIREKYADPDGKVRAIPIWFPIGDIHHVLVASYRWFTKGGLKASSFWEGGKLFCRYVPEPKAGEQPDPFRKLVRPCPMLTTKDCPHHGRNGCHFGWLIRCNVPGLRGMGEVIVPTASRNGYRECRANIERVAESNGGRFSGLFNGKPYFELVKVEDDVVTADGSRKKQWLPVIQLSIDLMELAAANEPMAVMARAQNALSLFGGGVRSAEPVAPPPEVTTPEPPDLDDGPDPEKVLDEAHARTLAEEEAAHAPPPEVTKFIEVLEKKTTGGGMSFPGLRVWARAELGVLSFEKAKLDDLKRVQARVLERVKSDRDEFVALLSDYAKAGKGGELPF